MTGTPPSLTRAEARERTRVLHVRSYDVELDLTRGDEVAGSRTTVSFLGLAPGSSTFIEITARRLVSATLNGVALPASAWDGHRLALAGLGVDNTLVVEAEVEYAQTGDGLYRTVDPEDGETYVGAYIGVVNAQRVFACFDQPDLKAELATRVVAPVGWTVVGNGRVIAGGADSGRWELAPTPRVSPYLFALFAGPLHAVRSEHRGVPMALYSRRALAPHLDREAAEILGVAAASYDRYAELFDEPYPFDKYDQVFVPGLNWGALEQVGCILFRDEYVFTSHVTDEQRLERANTIAHEMAHMWFGDLMTLHWWDDIWLNESFAEYMGARVVDEATAFTGSWEQFGGNRKPWGYAADDRPSTHPVAPDEADVVDTERALENFDGISYAKGAAALRQLVAWLGDDAFLAGVNDLIRERRFATATLDDLLDALARRSGRDVRGWADAWLRTTGHDTIRLERSAGEVVVTHPGVRPHLVVAGVYDRDPADSSRLVLRGEVPVRLEPGREREPIVVKGGEPAAVIVCQHDLTFASMRFDDATEAALRAGLSSVSSPLARVVVWTAWRDQVRHAETSPYDYLARVGRHLGAEPDPIVVDAVLEFALGVVTARYLDDAARPDGAALVREVCRASLARAERDGSSSLALVAVRGLVGAAGEEQADELLAWLSGAVPGGVPLDDELRWRVVVRLASLGRMTAAEVDEQLAAAPTQESALSATTARAARPDPEAKARAWEIMTGTGEAAASTSAVRAAASGFWVPGQDALLQDYVGRYLPAVQQVAQARGAWVAAALLTSGFPWHVVDLDLLHAAEAVAADPAQSSTVRRQVGDAAFDYRLAHTSRTRWSSRGGSASVRA
jgi:aminopeptidase N